MKPRDAATGQAPADRHRQADTAADRHMTLKNWLKAGFNICYRRGDTACLYSA